jgi:predicted DNA-binding transcriptional regulator AlpA
MTGERLLKARDVADLLGLEVATVVDRFQRGDLPGFRLYGNRPGSPLRFRLSEIEAWLETECRPPRGEQRVAAAAAEVEFDAKQLLWPLRLRP